MIDTNILKQNLTRWETKTRENLATIRTGRASSALIENIQVTTYNGEATLRIMELATINSGGAQELLVVPFDQTTIQDIEKKLRESSMGFSVSVEGNTIRVKMPPLSEEQRTKYVKLVNQFTEEGKEAIRRDRDEIRKHVKIAFETKELSEDQKYRMEQDIDKISKEFTERIEEMKKRKETEVTTI